MKEAQPSTTPRGTMFLHGQDPFRRAQFEHYAQNWLRIIPVCGGDLVGYFMPHEVTNNIAVALIAFDSMADYEAYRYRLKEDPAGIENFRFAEENRLIIEERRTFLKKVF